MSTSDTVSKHGKKRVYRLLCFMAWCDDELADAERKVLESYRERCELSEVEAAMLEGEGKNGVALDLGDRPAELRMLVDGLIDVAVADEVLVLDEQARLLRLAKELGLPEKQLVRHMRKRVKARGVPLTIERWDDEDEEEDEEE